MAGQAGRQCRRKYHIFLESDCRCGSVRGILNISSSLFRNKKIGIYTREEKRLAENRARKKKKRRKVQNVLPVNTKAKDTFFKKVYESEERQRRLVSFLLGIESEKVAVACVRPVLFGNKENDFSCICDGLFYIS